MAKIANVALTNTFNTWRVNSNQSFDRLSQFAINNSSLYANTITANNVLRSSGNTVLGAAGKRAIVTGLLSANGRATVGTNLTVSGNTTSNKLTVTNLFTSSGNTALGDGVADITTITGSASISKNLTVSGNTSSNKLTVTNLFTSSGNTALGNGVADITTITGSASISKNLTVSGNASVATLTATSDSSFTSTGAVTVSKGTTAQRPASPASGMFRFNTTNAEFEGYNGTAFASVGGAALSNDTTTAANLFPLFANSTSGSASSLFTSNSKLVYKPSTGELKVFAPVAHNGISVNSTTVAASYTIASGTNGFSVGPITVNSGATVTIAAGQRWYVI